MQRGIIRITTRYVDGSPIEPEGVLLKWRNGCGVVAGEKCNRKNARNIMGIHQRTLNFPFRARKD
jgi:hypothetical protein